MRATHALLCGGLMLALLGSANAHAGTKEGRVVSINVYSGAPDRVFVKVEGGYSDPEPACSVGVTQWDFVIDISGTTGRAMYSLALAAQASAAMVTVGGTGACSLWGGYEDLSYIHTNPQ